MNSNKIISSMQGIALDGINNVGQGHAGMAIGAAPITYSLIGENLKISKTNPHWINRDRFVLSAGHGSMSFYSIMHFLGLLSVDDMKKHKVLHSKTPSHPEIDMFDYVDATTGPLGQGVAMAVGMAISLKKMKEKYNKKNMEYFDHSVFALHGDGCIQEGVALEAIQLAGTLGLGDLILIHDFNEIQIDSSSKEVNNINFKEYMESQGFDVFVVDEPSVDKINDAISRAKLSLKPSYIQIKTVIATNTEFEGKSVGHNFTLNEESTIEFKEKIGIVDTTPFKYDEEVYEEAKKLWINKEKLEQQWNDLDKRYKNNFPDEWEEIQNIYNETLNVSLKHSNTEQDVATRNYIVGVMKQLNELPNIIGGSADLAGATKVVFNTPFKKGGNQIRYGIREFAMAAINNGIYLHSHLRTIDSTFLAFSDYSKAAIRLGAIMEIPSIHVFTHDSYQVGGDGPTHQPVSQLPMLRSIPNVKVIRPCDESETIEAFNHALSQDKEQYAIIFCRQPIKSFNLSHNNFEPAYIIKNSDDFDVSILATGSEVDLAFETSKLLETKGISSQVISVPLLQDLVDNKSLIQKLNIDKKPIYSIEASSEMMWYKLSKYNKFEAFTAQGFGHSAPGDVVYAEKGFTPENISKRIQEFLG